MVILADENAGQALGRPPGLAHGPLRELEQVQGLYQYGSPASLDPLAHHLDVPPRQLWEQVQVQVPTLVQVYHHEPPRQQLIPWHPLVVYESNCIPSG